MITIRAKPGTMISLGREGENLAREVIFDVSRWQEEYGPGTVSLIAQRQGDTEPYPCAITVDGATITWTVTSADTAKKGYGRCELQYRVGDTLAKSEAWCTGTYDALGEPTTEPPPPYQGWVDQVLEAGQKAQDAAVNSPKIGENGNWYVWDFEAGAYVDTGVAASGGGGSPYTLPAMTPTALGGAMADPAEAGDTQPVRIGADHKLYTAPGGGDGKYSPTLPLVASITLTEEVSMIEISTDKDGNPLSLEEMDIYMQLYGGAGNTSRDNTIVYFNGVSTAIGRKNLGVTIGAAGLALESSQYYVKREYGFRQSGQYGYGSEQNSSTLYAVNATRFIDAYEKIHTKTYPKFTQVNMYPATEGYKFGVGTTIYIYGR